MTDLIILALCVVASLTSKVTAAVLCELFLGGRYR